MKQFVALAFRRNRGWPWPEKSWGLDPMFGAEGWCPACGVPRHPQSGSIVLQRRGLKVTGAWIPNWRFDTVCLEQEIADQVAARFQVELRPISWPDGSDMCAMQIVIPSGPAPWFNQEQLRTSAIERHGTDGVRCGICGVWKWMPLGLANLPRLVDTTALSGFDIVASPEWFGDGMRAFRQVLVERELATYLTGASPRDFVMREIRDPYQPGGFSPSETDSPATPVPAGVVSEVFTATLLAESRVQGDPSASTRRAAVAARELLVSSGGLVSADALTIAAHRFFDGGEVDEALSLWRQAAAHGSAAALEALRRYAANS